MNKPTKILLISVVAFLIASASHAEPWTGIIDEDRATDWSIAGAGTIPARTTICSTLSPGATVAQINTALNSCPSGQTVKLNAGTYSLNGVIRIPSNVTLRGAGPMSTFLNWTGGFSAVCNTGTTEAICIGVNSGYYDSPANVANITATGPTGNYAKGDNLLTLSSVSNLNVGELILIDQADDASCGTGPCVSEAISSEGGSLVRAGRSQIMVAKITNIAGNVVTIYPPLIHPNWVSSKSPGAWWPSSITTAAGLEDLTVNTGTYAPGTNISIWHTLNCWVKNVRSIKLESSGGRNHIFIAEGGFNTVRDSYIYGSNNAANLSYGIESNTGGFNLIENNISQHVVSPILPGSISGDVYGYNYSIDHFRSDNIYENMPGPVWAHDAKMGYSLTEGTQGTGQVLDNIHGTVTFDTIFRNQYSGRDPTRTNHTQAFDIGSYARYHNIIGNVLGEAGYHNKYESYPGNTTNCTTSILKIGFQSPSACSSTEDIYARSTMFRWGNYDVVNGTVRWESSEVPSGDSYYPNAVPANHTLPSSFYLTSRPSWWVTTWGTPPWPATGPDITGGNVTSGSGTESTLDGHANKIPARLCYENTSQTSGILNFDAADCYAAGSGDETAPSVLITHINGEANQSATYSTSSSMVTLAGTVYDAVGVVTNGVTWANSAGGSGTATCANCDGTAGTKDWSQSGITLQSGENIITIYGAVAVPNTGTDVLTVTYETTPPTVTSASVNGATATINFSETVVTTGYDTGDFNLDCTSPTLTDVSLSSPSGSGSSRTFTIATPIVYGQTCNLDYVGTAGDITDSAGNNMVAINNISVTNNTPNPADLTPPVCIINNPTTNTTWPTSSATITVGGSATDGVGVTSISWACPTCTPASGVAICVGCTGQSVTWSQLVALTSGANVFTATATDGVNTHADAITITYTPGVGPAEHSPSDVRGVTLRGVKR